jgi:hypothetical protein
MKDKESNCHSNKCNFWSLAPKGAGHQDELAIDRNVTWTSKADLIGDNILGSKNMNDAELT